MSRLHVDRTLCDGRGLGVELLPEILDRDEWGYPLVRGAAGPGGDPEVPRSLRAEAHDAVRACPRRALTTVDSPGYS